MNDHSFAFYGFAFFGIILARYFILAGGMHLFLYGIFDGLWPAFSSLLSETLRERDASAKAEALPTRTRRFCVGDSLPLGTGRGFANANSNRQPQPAREAEIDRRRLPPPWKSIRRDIKLSVLSSIVFALAAATIVSAYELGITRLYADVDRYPLWYLAVSYVLAIVLQDTYFYFLHRLFHHPLLFRRWHQGHHQSRHPTPWTSFAFDPPEAIVQSLFLVAIVFIIPLHFITVIAILITMTVWAVVNHLGIERLPLNFPHHWCSRWFTGPAHHAVHHRQYGLHYGLYFTFWDKQLGTQSPDYDREFADVPH